MRRIEQEQEPRVALVLSGGGARGAYEAGVVRYLREALERDTGVAARFDILCGTSVGGIHAGFLAATAHDPAAQSRVLGETWRTLRAQALVELRPLDLVRFGAELLGLRRARTARHGALLGAGQLERLVAAACDWTRIAPNIEKGHLHSLSISATHVATGRTVVFVQTPDGIVPPWSRDPRVRVVAARIGPQHALASAALPLLFPPVALDGELYCDGGLRQNTPLSPALRLGADRVLIVSLRHSPSAAEMRLDRLLGRERALAMPSPAFVLGKVLNALLLDHLDYDLDRMHRINAILAAGEAAFGAGFAARLNPPVDGVAGMPMRQVAHLRLAPSEDIGGMAARYVRSSAFDGRGVVGALLRRLAASEARDEADFLSYLLFDGGYAELLLDLGWEDARSRRNELAELFAGDAIAVQEHCTTGCICAHATRRIFTRAAGPATDP
jgi:NTE family protein